MANAPRRSEYLDQNSYLPSKNLTLPDSNLYIDAEAFKALGGVYLCQMSPVIPVAQLVDDTVVKLVLHTLVRALFRIFIGRAEFTGGIAAVDRKVPS